MKIYVYFCSKLYWYRSHFGSRLLLPCQFLSSSPAMAQETPTGAIFNPEMMTVMKLKFDKALCAIECVISCGDRVDQANRHRGSGLSDDINDMLDTASGARWKLNVVLNQMIDMMSTESPDVIKSLLVDVKEGELFINTEIASIYSSAVAGPGSCAYHTKEFEEIMNLALAAANAVSEVWDTTAAVKQAVKKQVPQEGQL